MARTNWTASLPRAEGPPSVADVSETHPGASPFIDRHGKVRWRYRRKGKTTPLPEAPGHPAFEAAYSAAVEGRTPVRAKVTRHPSAAFPRSMGAAWRAAKQTPEFKRQVAETRLRQDKIAEAFLHGRVIADDPSTWAEMPIADLRRRHIKAILADRSDTPHAGRHLLSIIRKMIYAAIDAEWIEIDPSHRMRYRPAYVGWRAWTEKERAAFEKRWPIGTTPRLCYALALWLGNRRGDIATLRPQDIDGDKIRLEQGKTGRELVLPITPMLREALDAADLSKKTVLSTVYGKPFSIKSLTGRMADWTKAAGIPPGCTLHGLRKTLGKMLAEEGATTRQIMDALGHTDIKHAELYSRDAEQERLARDAMNVVSLRRGKPGG